MIPGSVTMNCPSCGAEVPSALAYSKLAVCAHCNTTLFLEDQVVKQAGVKSVLAQDPSIFSLGGWYQYKGWVFAPLGRVRFDYGDGYWDEWWVLRDTGEGRWMSVDEGDIAFEVAIDVSGEVPDVAALRVGQAVQLDGMHLKVTERHKAVCLGMEGELPEVNFPGDEHDYAHLSGPRGLLVTGEHFNGETRFYKGAWVDPFEVRSL